jgi:sugar transferase (PEP-CTERM/EpsH1 system associated)
MSNLLFLCHRIPYPPDKGDKIRSWHLLQHLSRRHKVHLGCFIDDPADAAHLPLLRKVCADVAAFPLGRGRAGLRVLGGLARGEPFTLAWFGDGRLARWVDETYARTPIDAEIVFSSAMAQYLPKARPADRKRLVDFVDVDSEKWAQYASMRAWPFSWACRREARRLGEVERRIAAGADACLFVSEEEAALFRRGLAASMRTDAARSSGAIVTMPNGVDTECFNPAIPFPDPYGAGPPVLVFVGRMDYWANADGAAWLVQEVLRRLLTRVPAVRLFIVGAAPSRAVRALAQDGRVFVTGRVPDVRPYLAHADLAVVPLRVARGVQNKALEAMAMGKAVVTTPAAHEGLEAEPGLHLAVAAGPDAFADASARLLSDAEARDRMGRAARRRMVERYAWAARLRTIDALLDISRHVLRAAPG